MEQRLDIISADELFGSNNQLVEQVGENTLSDISSLGAVYQIVTAIIALLFLFILVRYFGLFYHLIITSLNKKRRNSDTPMYASEINNVKVFSGIMGTLLLSLLTMRLSVMEWLNPLFEPLLEMPVWTIGALTLGGVVATMLGERILLYLVGVVSDRGDACNTIWHTKLLYFSLVIILMSPMLIVVLLTDGIATKIALCTSVIVCLLLLFLFIKDTFLFFRTQRFSIFHWILYLCALEIFPLSLLLAPIVRG